MRAASTTSRSIVDALPVSVMLLGTDGTIHEINPSGLFMVEAESFDRVREQPYQHIVSPEFRSAFLEMVRKVAGGATETLEYQITGLRGTRRWLETDAAPFRAPGGEITAILTVTRDTSARFHREGKARYDQKMEAIATLASGVAHDFNNIMTAIVGYANVLRIKLPEGDALRPLAGQILTVADRAASIIKGLLSFGTKQYLNLKTVDLNASVRKTATSFIKENGDGIAIDVKTSDATLIIMADEAQIEHSITNMLSNARDAMPRGGTISISTGAMELEDAFISIHGYGTRGSYAVVTVTDTGTGMDERTRKKAFEPFFTTKKAGKGLGLGLAVVYGVVKSHRGYVNVYSEPGIGSTFRLYLPLAGVRVTDSTPDPLIHEGKGETILLAEDEKPVRDITASILEQFGYRVVTATDGEEAVKRFREHDGAVRLLLFDINMPRVDGWAAFNEIKRIRPDIRVLFTSGYTEEFIRSQGLVDAGVPVISKPISPRDLLRMVREVLER